MKIYLIKFDACPFSPTVSELANLIGGTMLRQISGCYTTETTIQILSGKHSSVLEPHGNGYQLWQRKSDNMDPMELRPVEDLPKYDWMENTLPFRLAKYGFKTKATNDPVLSYVLGFLRCPEIYTHTYVSKTVVKKKEEIEYTQQAQKEKQNVLYFISHMHFHHACDDAPNSEVALDLTKKAWIDLLELMSYWDFDESDSFFWIYSDHGPWRRPEFGGYPLPLNFYTWAVLKDNTSHSFVPKLKTASATDLPQIIMNKFGGPAPNEEKGRIYITEDGRMSIDPFKSTTAIACKVKDSTLRYLTYHEPDNKFIQRVGSAITKCIDEELLDALKENFKWIK